MAVELGFKNQASFNVKLMAGPVALWAEKGLVHTGATAWARGQAFARGTDSPGFQKALGAMIKTEGDLQAYFGFKTGEQLLMRGAQAVLLGFAMYAENRQLPANWHLEKMPKPVKYTLEIARVLYFASLVAAPVILDKMIKGEPVEPVSAGLVLGTAGAGLLYSGLRIAAANNIEARERRKEELLSREIDFKVNDWKFNYQTEEIMKALKKKREESEAKNQQMGMVADHVGKIREAEAYRWAQDEAPEIVPCDLIFRKRGRSFRVRVAQRTENQWRREN